MVVSGNKSFLFLLTLFLIVANIADGLITYIGLELNIIEEGNPLMDSAYSHSSWLFILIKLVIVPSALIFVYKVGSKTNSKVVVSWCAVASTVYLYVLGLHAYWMTLYSITVA